MCYLWSSGSTISWSASLKLLLQVNLNVVLWDYIQHHTLDMFLIRQNTNTVAGARILVFIKDFLFHMEILHLGIRTVRFPATEGTILFFKSMKYFRVFREKIGNIKKLRKTSDVIMKNLTGALTAQHHWLKWWNRAIALARVFIITPDIIGTQMRRKENLMPERRIKVTIEKLPNIYLNFFIFKC